MPDYTAIKTGFHDGNRVRVGQTVSTEEPFDPLPSWLVPNDASEIAKGI